MIPVRVFLSLYCTEPVTYNHSDTCQSFLISVQYRTCHIQPPCDTAQSIPISVLYRTCHIQPPCDTAKSFPISFLQTTCHTPVRFCYLNTVCRPAYPTMLLSVLQTASVCTFAFLTPFFVDAQSVNQKRKVSKDNFSIIYFATKVCQLTFPMTQTHYETGTL